MANESNINKCLNLLEKINEAPPSHRHTIFKCERLFFKIGEYPLTKALKVIPRSRKGFSGHRATKLMHILYRLMPEEGRSLSNKDNINPHQIMSDIRWMKANGYAQKGDNGDWELSDFAIASYNEYLDEVNEIIDRRNAAEAAGQSYRGRINDDLYLTPETEQVINEIMEKLAEKHGPNAAMLPYIHETKFGEKFQDSSEIPGVPRARTIREPAYEGDAYNRLLATGDYTTKKVLDANGNPIQIGTDAKGNPIYEEEKYEPVYEKDGKLKRPGGASKIYGEDVDYEDAEEDLEMSELFTQPFRAKKGEDPAIFAERIRAYDAEHGDPRKAGYAGARKPTKSWLEMQARAGLKPLYDKDGNPFVAPFNTNRANLPRVNVGVQTFEPPFGQKGEKWTAPDGSYMAPSAGDWDPKRLHMPIDDMDEMKHLIANGMLAKIPSRIKGRGASYAWTEKALMAANALRRDLATEVNGAAANERLGNRQAIRLLLETGAIDVHPNTNMKYRPMRRINQNATGNVQRGPIPTDWEKDFGDRIIRGAYTPPTSEDAEFSEEEEADENLRSPSFQEILSKLRHSDRGDGWLIKNPELNWSREGDYMFPSDIVEYSKPNKQGVVEPNKYHYHRAAEEDSFEHLIYPKDPVTGRTIRGGPMPIPADQVDTIKRPWVPPPKKTQEQKRVEPLKDASKLA